MQGEKLDETQKRIKALAAEVSAALDADLLLYTGPITMHGFEHVEEGLRNRKRKEKNVLFFLMTLGGDAHAAYRIARCIGHYYKRFSIIVTNVCKSAGTLLCLGANELVVSEGGELGPLDVQLKKED